MAPKMEHYDTHNGSSPLIINKFIYSKITVITTV